MIRSMNLCKNSCSTSILVCEAYMKGKQYPTKLGNDVEKEATKPLEIVHLGVCGPMRNLSMGGAKYFVTFMNEFLRKV